jgi:hypothetical protein
MPTPTVGTSEVSMTIVGQLIAPVVPAPTTTGVEPLAIQVSTSVVTQTKERMMGEDAVVMHVMDTVRSVATLPP